jgi:transglutaminase-like putative cysteine protease
MRISVEHSTVFRYTADVWDVVMEMRLQPTNDAFQQLLGFALFLTPPAITPHFRDGFGNVVHMWSYRPPHREISIVARSVVETDRSPKPETALREVERRRFLQFGGPVEDVPGVRRVADELRGLDPLDALYALTSLIPDRFGYEPNVTAVDTTVSDFLAVGAGVCQDFTHFWLAVARALGLPSRYVSGYIYNPPNGPIRGAFASHAWGETWLPGLGWTGFDPTNRGPAGDHHVAVAVGRDYRDVAPTKGVFRGSATETMEVSVVTELLPEEDAARV